MVEGGLEKNMFRGPVYKNLDIVLRLFWQYDAFGSSDSSGAGGPFGDFAGGAWNFRSSIDPEELFRTIFGDKSWRGGGGPQDMQFDFGAPLEYQVIQLSFF